jgi:trehalose 6-phosphate phosphatase
MTSDDVLVGVDFDGTLAPHVDHPDDAVPDARAIELLSAISARPNVEVAVVSGRALDSLRARLGEVSGATLVGEHGNDLGDSSPPDPLIDAAISLIEGIASEAGGATVERKPHSVTFHYRRLEDDEADGYLERIRAWASGHHRVTLLEGKSVVELSTATRNKGDAIMELAQGRPVIYIGDDATDETVFEILGPDDVGVKVGDGATVASHRVEDVDGVVAILEQIDLASR